MQVTNLRAYLCEIGMTVKDFCEIIEYNHMYVSGVLNGKRLATHRLAREISRATGGIVQIKAAPRKKDQKQQQDSAA